MRKTPPRTYLTPAVGRPTQASLSEELELDVPHRFARFVSNLYDYGNGDPQICLDAFDASLGLFPRGESARYDGTPPELFPIGSTGCDGDHYGFLLRAPELKSPDLPLCHYCPMDSDGVISVGSDTESGIAAIMARHLSYDFVREDKKALLRDTAKACGIEPAARPVVECTPPDGWRFVQSSDGVGTLAPNVLFDPQIMHSMVFNAQPEAILKTADAAMRAGFVATALHFLREGLWYNWFAKPTLLAERMVAAYEAMNRKQLADQVIKSIARWQNTTMPSDGQSANFKLSGVRKVP